MRAIRTVVFCAGGMLFFLSGAFGADRSVPPSPAEVKHAMAVSIVSTNAAPTAGAELFSKPTSTFSRPEGTFSRPEATATITPSKPEPLPQQVERGAEAEATTTTIDLPPGAVLRRR